jgi:hypothetical protein
MTMAADRSSNRTSSTTKKSSSAKGGNRRAAAKKSGDQRASNSGQASEKREAPRAASAPKRNGLSVAREAAQQLQALTGRDVEGVTAVKRTDDGWTIDLEVLEVRRIPETADVLATYEVTVDSHGDVEGFRRAGRYTRGSAKEDR